MNASTKTIDINLNGLKKATEFVIEILDNESGNIKPYFDKIGSPRSPNRQTIADLKMKAYQTKKFVLKADKKGCLHIQLELSPWACALIKEK